MVAVFREVIGKDQNIIHVNDNPPCIDLLLKGLVHVGLEGSGGVTEAEKHDIWLEEAPFGRKCSEVSVIRVYKDIIVSPSDIHLGEILGITEFVDQGGNQG
jgi:hypothetical protein